LSNGTTHNQKVKSFEAEKKQVLALHDSAVSMIPWQIRANKFLSLPYYYFLLILKIK